MNWDKSVNAAVLGCRIQPSLRCERELVRVPPQYRRTTEHRSIRTAEWTGQISTTVHKQFVGKQIAKAGQSEQGAAAQIEVLDARHVRGEDSPGCNPMTAVVRLERTRSPWDLVETVSRDTRAKRSKPEANTFDLEGFRALARPRYAW